MAGILQPWQADDRIDGLPVKRRPDLCMEMADLMAALMASRGWWIFHRRWRVREGQDGADLAMFVEDEEYNGQMCLADRGSAGFLLALRKKEA
ncbi:hypothetical protein ACLOJK_025791 [Asimina triloba]